MNDVIYLNSIDVDEFIDVKEMAKGTFGKPGWFNAVKLEYQACKERVCLVDMSSFTKIEIKVNCLLMILCVFISIHFYVHLFHFDYPIFSTFLRKVSQSW